MKKIIIPVLFFMNLCFSASKTTFIPRLMSTNQTFELAQINYSFHKNVEGNSPLFDIKPFYQTSVHNKKNARFFLIDNLCSVSIREDGAGDIDSLWFNLIAASPYDYQSYIAIKPQRTNAGLIFTLYSYLPWLHENLWFGLNTVFVHAQNRVHFSQGNTPYPGTLPGFANSLQAFTNPDWCGGKFYCNSRKNNAFDDIQLKLGYDVVHTLQSWAAPYLLVTVPTGKKVKSKYIFEPLIGSRHASLGVGFDAEIELYYQDEAILSCMIDSNYRYVFKAQERRTFDLKNGDWSRYLQVATKNEPLNSMPGINYFTRCVSVTPASTFQLWSALHYSICQWQLELGYNFWVRAQEKIHLSHCSRILDVGIFDLSGVCNPPATSASTATIAQGVSGSNQVVKDAVFTPIRLRDFNISSGQNCRALSNTLYASVAHEWGGSCHSFLLGLNGSYEFSNYINGLSQVSCWIDIAITF